MLAYGSTASGVAFEGQKCSQITRTLKMQDATRFRLYAQLYVVFKVETHRTRNHNATRFL